MKQNGLLKRCINALFFGVGGAIGSRVFMAIANIFISRILGQEVYGEFSNINTTVNLFVTFSGIGVSATLTRYISVVKDDKEKQGIYVKTLYCICMVMSCILSLVLFVFAKPISQLSSGTMELTSYFKIVAVTVFFAAMSSVEQSIMLGYERFAASSLVQLIRCFMFMILGIVLSMKMGLLGSAVALVITHMIQYVLSYFINKKYLNDNDIHLVFDFNDEIKTILVKFALPAFASGILVLPINWIGNSILTRYRGFGELAIFFVASQWMAYITYIPSQLGQMRPIYTDLYVKNNISDLKKIFLRTTLYTTAVAALAGVVFIMGSKIILRSYGDGYERGQKAFIFMILAAVIYTAQVQTGFIMQAFGKMWVSFVVNAVWGISIISVLWLLKARGAEGYAIAYVTAYAIIFLIQMYVVIKVFNSRRIDKKG